MIIPDTPYTPSLSVTTQQPADGPLISPAYQLRLSSQRRNPLYPRISDSVAMPANCSAASHLLSRLSLLPATVVSMERQLQPYMIILY